MRKILLVTTLLVVAQLTAACNADLRSNAYPTSITFTVEGFHQTTLDTVSPLVDVILTVPGHAPELVADDVPVPYRHTVTSSEYSQVQYDAQVTAKLVEPNDNVILRCSWSAQTPFGRRLSRDASDSEGESYAGAPVTCHYAA